MRNPEHQSNPENKLELWTSKTLEIDAITDRLGKRIDEGIKEVIIGLTLLNINTTASCEGHLDRGTFAPYIDIESPKAKVLAERHHSLETEDEERSINKEIQKANLEELENFIPLLDEFYADRHSTFHQRLTIRAMPWGWSRIQSGGTELQKVADKQLKSDRLLEFQKEMEAFKVFLKKKYMGM